MDQHFFIIPPCGTNELKGVCVCGSRCVCVCIRVLMSYVSARVNNLCNVYHMYTWHPIVLQTNRPLTAITHIFMHYNLVIHIFICLYNIYILYMYIYIRRENGLYPWIPDMPQHAS